MEQYFFILYIVVLAIVFGFAIFLLKHLRQEYELYRLFSKNGDMRALMAKDPRRFHISLVYLMTYMTRSDGDAVQYEKLELIVRYIREVCPVEYQQDAMEALSYLTFREKGSGKHRKTESVVDVDAFNKGSKNCLKSSDNSFHYQHDLHGKRLAEELALYMTEEDRLYVMYMLFRLAIADDKITTKGKKSETYMLHRLCVKGLKIEKEKLENLLQEFTQGNELVWYEKQFSRKGSLYPSADVIADIFRKDENSLSFLNTQVPQTSVLGSIQSALIFSGVVFFGLFFLFIKYEEDLMGDVYPKWFFIVGLVAALLVPFVTSISVKELESSLLPVLRTKIENSLQLKGLVAGSILSLIVIVVLFWGVTNTLFLMANEAFSNKETFVVTVPVTDTYTTTTRSRNHTTTHYHVRFPEISLADRQFDTEHRKRVSLMNGICLKTLPVLSGMKLKGVKNTKTMTNLEVNHSTYSSALGKNIRLYYKTGYFGLVYFDDYQLE